DPAQPDFKIASLQLSGEVPPVRLSDRRRLLDQIERHARTIERTGRPATYNAQAQLAFDVLLSGPSRAAFDLHREPVQLRERYVRNKFGQSLLLARRLIEAGVRFVQVNWPREPGDLSVGNPLWDTHFDNAGRCRDTLCPPFDLGFATLLE